MIVKILNYFGLYTVGQIQKIKQDNFSKGYQVAVITFEDDYNKGFTQGIEIGRLETLLSLEE